MEKYKKLWIGLISLGIAVLLFTMFIAIQFNMQKEVEYKEVIFAKDYISKNILITEENVALYFEKRQVPSEWIPEGTISDDKELYGKMTTAEFSKGTIVTDGNVKERAAFYEDYKNLTWISVYVDELFAGVAGTLREGDYIDIYTLAEQEDVWQCELLAERVRVDSTYNGSGGLVDSGDKKGISQLIIIPLEKALVSDFYVSLAKGNIRIAKYEM